MKPAVNISITLGIREMGKLGNDTKYSDCKQDCCDNFQKDAYLAYWLRSNHYALSVDFFKKILNREKTQDW